MRRTGLLLVWLLVTVQVPAQDISFLDTLPDCNFTQAAPDPDLIVGAVAYNYRTGTGCAENLDQAFPVASVPKLFVLATMFEWVLENEAITFETELTFSERYWMGGRGDCLDGATLNQRVTIGELGDVMIACSDNAATWMLMDAMGWERVDAYVDALEIENIGPVIPYSEVDRQKLIFMDEGWQHVPVATASRFYRSEMVTGLNIYFDTIPDYSRQDMINANAQYFAETNFNTISPRAMAEYLIRLRADSQRTDNRGQIARWVFNTMLLTDRQFTAQALPGTVTVGAKNGWDTGLRAEVSVLFDFLPGKDRVPSGFVIVFARQQDFESTTLQLATPNERGIINRYLLSLAPVLRDMLFPSYTSPDVINSGQVSTTVVNPKALLDSCWAPYANNGFLFNDRGRLESCWANQTQSQIAPGDSIGVGVVLQRLNEADARLTFIFTTPDGVTRSYQAQRFFQTTAALYYWEPVPQDQTGIWTVEVYLNRNPILRRQIEIAPLF